MALKFGSPAWRKKYADKAKRYRAKSAKRKNAPRKRKTAKRRVGANTFTKRGFAAKKKRMKEMLRSNPPRKWTKVKSVRVIRKGGRDILEIRK